MAGTIGLVQNDIKRVLAYSTVSQLGVHVPRDGRRRVRRRGFSISTRTRSSRRSCSWGRARSSTRSTASRISGTWAASGRSDLPITVYWTFLIGSLAIAGVPGLAGFFSKDEILFLTFAEWAHAAVGDRAR